MNKNLVGTILGLFLICVFTFYFFITFYTNQSATMTVYNNPPIFEQCSAKQKEILENREVENISERFVSFLEKKGFSKTNEVPKTSYYSLGKDQRVIYLKGKYDSSKDFFVEVIYLEKETRRCEFNVRTYYNFHGFRWDIEANEKKVEEFGDYIQNLGQDEWL